MRIQVAIAAVLAIAPVYSSAQNYKSGEPPRGEPFYRFLGEDECQHCQHGNESNWAVVGQTYTGWRYWPFMHGNVWGFYNPQHGWALSDSVGPNSHNTVRIWVHNSQYQGPEWPWLNPEGQEEHVDVPYNTDWTFWQHSFCDPGVGAGE